MINWFMLGTLFVGAIAARVYIHYNKKRFPHATGVDTAVWGTYIFSLFFAAALYFSHFFLPDKLYSSRIHSDDIQETKIQKLIEKDEQNREIVNELRDAMFIQLIATGVYVFSIAMFIGTIQKKRNIALLESNSEIKNPLGL